MPGSKQESRAYFASTLTYSPTESSPKDSCNTDYHDGTDDTDDTPTQQRRRKEPSGGSEDGDPLARMFSGAESFWKSGDYEGAEQLFQQEW